MKLVFREAKQSDLMELLEIQKQAFMYQAEKYDAYDIPPMVETEDDINLSNPNLTVMVAEVDEKLAGSIRLLKDGDCAEIKRLSVSKDFQKRGIGRKLMNEIEKYSGELSRLWLFTGGQSYINIELYKKLGYKIIKEEPFKDDFTLVYMEKELKKL